MQWKQSIVTMHTQHAPCMCVCVSVSFIYHILSCYIFPGQGLFENTAYKCTH